MNPDHDREMEQLRAHVASLETLLSVYEHAVLVQVTDGVAQAPEMSEERYRVLFESNPHPLWVYDLESLSFLAVNEAAVASYGYSRREFLSMTIRDIRPQEDIPALVEVLTKPPKGLNTAGCWRHRKKDGSIIDVEITGYPLMFGAKRAELILARDVTERKRVERALQEAGARMLEQESVLLGLIQSETLRTADLKEALRHLTEVIARTLGVERVSIWRYSRDRQRIHCVDLFELSRNHHSEGIELEAANYPAYFEALGTSRIIAAEDACRDSRTSEFSVSYLARHGIGAMMDVPISLFGRLEGVLCHEHVGTPRQWMQDEQLFAMSVSNLIALAYEQWERKRVEEALRESEARFKAFMNNSPVVAFMKDEEGRLIYVNEPLARRFGRPADEWLGKTDAQSWPADIADRLRENDRAVLTGDKVVELEEAVPTPDGAIHQWLAFKFPFCDAAGKRVLAGIALDITDRKQLEEQLRHAQKMEAVGRLAGGIAHDFNNLLTVITGYSQLLLRRIAPSDGLRAEVEGISQAGDRAAALTKQLLAFSRRQVVQPMVLDVNVLVTNLVDMLQRVIGEDIRLVTRLVPGAARVMFDPGQLEQVLVNLTVNVRDAMPEGGTLTIETETAQHGDGNHVSATSGPIVRLVVRDTGCGMNDDTLSHLFEPFFTTKELGKGTGLGLATVYGIVKQGGGAVEVNSALGNGTTFAIKLPRVEADTKAAAVLSTRRVSSHGTETILVVEDQEMVRQYLRNVLKAYGYRLLEASNGTDALRYAEEHHGRIDLLLTDVVMPCMNGRQLSKELAAARPEIKVLFMSGYAGDAVLRDEFPTDLAFLPKPIAPDALLNAVRQLLDTPLEPSR